MKGYDFAIAAIPNDFQMHIFSLVHKTYFDAVTLSDYLNFIQPGDRIMVNT